MGKRGHLPPPVLKCCEVFCALVVTAECSLDELFMHYFHNLSSAFGGFSPDLTGAPSLDSAGGTLVPRPLICPPLREILRAPTPCLQNKLQFFKSLAYLWLSGYGSDPQSSIAHTVYTQNEQIIQFYVVCHCGHVLEFLAKYFAVWMRFVDYFEMLHVCNILIFIHQTIVVAKKRKHSYI